MDDETETSTMVTIILLASKIKFEDTTKNDVRAIIPMKNRFHSFSRPKMATLRTPSLNDWPLVVPGDLGLKEGSHHFLAG